MNNVSSNELKSWPFEEARKILSRKNNKGYILFETGYGPSGLPHIGTFGEVLRTTYVRNALKQLSDIETKLFCFSDDMDGLRKVPTNIPNQEMISNYIDIPLTNIPDPFGCHESYGQHNNSKLREFLDSFGFDYEFKSATECYKSGEFNTILLKVLEHSNDILDIMLPSLREERASTYSPILPICPKTGKVLQVKVEEFRTKDGTVVYKDEDGKFVEVPVTNGHCKLQWKADWAMRWCVYGVDYEMHGKDLIDSAKLAGRICSVIGYKKPELFSYELFLDENNKKISKSKGNGITMDDWLKYAPKESLANYMFLSPKSGKRLCFDVIPKNVDEYLNNLDKYSKDHNMDNPVWHIHFGNVPERDSDISFNILLNLASVCNADNEEILWGFITKYRKDLSSDHNLYLSKLVVHAVKYYQKFIKPNKSYKSPSDIEREALKLLYDALESMDVNDGAEKFQYIVFEVGKKYFASNLKSWFQLLYESLLGQKDGPRMGSFIEIYGLQNFLNLIKEHL